VTWIDADLVLVSLAAMASPTTLSFSVLARVLGDRPLRPASGSVSEPSARRSPSGSLPHSCSGRLCLGWVGVEALGRGRRPRGRVGVARPCRAHAAQGARPSTGREEVARMSKVASSPARAIVGAGTVLANLGPPSGGSGPPR
jgi:hypothetical protein